MKKLLLSFATAVCAIFSASAADVVIDFGEVTAQDKSAQAVVSGVTLNLSPTGKAYLNKGYLFLTGKGSSSEVSFTIPQEATSIVLTTTSGCSVNAGNTIAVYVNDQLVVEKFGVNKLSTDFTIPLNGLGVAGATYRIATDGSYNSQIAKITLTEPSTEAVFNVETKSLNFAAVNGGFQDQVVKMNNANLTEDITITYSNPVFAGPDEVSKDDNSFEIEFSTWTPGNYEGTATLKSGDFEATVVLSAFMAAHTGDEDDPLSVSDVVKMNNGVKGPFYVSGEIASYGAANQVDGVLQEGEPAVSNIVLVEDDYKIGIQLPNNEIRAALNIVDNPENAGKTAMVCGNLETYFGAPGVKSLSMGEIVEEEDVLAAPVITVNNVTVETHREGEFLVGEMRLDSSVKEANVFMSSGSAQVLVYYTITDESGTSAVKQFLDTIKVDHDCLIEAYSYDFDWSTWDEVYSRKVQIAIVFDTNNGVEGIEAADSDAVYFDLTGRQVENPAVGIYVKVANGKAQKVTVK